MPEGVGARGGRFGYRRPYAILNRLINILLASVVLILALPLMLVVALIILLDDGLPVFYVGRRLGQDKQPFDMYKFRTLVLGAESIIGAELLSEQHQLTLPFGKVLRDTRLDELPQLFNILKGDMDFVGPRPVRPKVYESVCRHIRNYDQRFRVKPGLLGLSQLMTPHSTPKRIRSLIDNLLIRKKQKLAWDLWYILFTAFMVMRATANALWKAFYRRVLLERILSRYDEKRRMERIRPRDAWVAFEYQQEDPAKLVRAVLVDINEEALLMTTKERLEKALPEILTLEVRPHVALRGKGVRKARCRGRIYRELKLDDDCWGYVVVYEPVSPLNFYICHQYLLERSVA